ncbi:hypothetical protein D9M69_442800 [compost metagenome]
MADGFFQHHAGAPGQPGGGQAFADGAVHGGGRGEVGDQPAHRTQLVGQGRVGLGVEEVHGEVVEPGQEALHGALLQLARRHVVAQVLADHRDMAGRLAAFAAQGEDACIGGQQAGTVQLIERGKQLAQRQVTKAAKQGQGAGFDRLRGHDICSSFKHELMNTPR